MEFVSPTLSSILWLPVASIVFLLPGWMLTRAWPSPMPAVTAFFGSAAILFNLVLLLDLVGVPLHAGTVAVGLALSAAAIWKLLPRASAEPISSAPPNRWRLLWLVAPGVALVSIGLRAAIDPLSGYDNGFRWDYLARLILAHRSLADYPPISASDFEFYGWCDGIPPLVPLLNFWIYAATGSIAPSLTALRIVGEAALLGVAVYRYGELLWRGPAGASCLAALAASALALWSVAMGQETGLTALSLVAMLYFLELHAQDPQDRHLFWAAVAGGVGAIARDYTLGFPLLGFGMLLARARTGPGALRFAIIAAVIAGPWYLRNWIITGNPLYPQTLGGLFPGNAVHEEMMRYIAEYWSPGTSQFDPRFIPEFLAALAGMLGVVGVVGITLAGRRALPALSGIVVTTGLWVLSIPQTAGGWIYSARVLLPALALLAVLAGWMAGTRVWLRGTLMVVLGLGALDAARRSWFLPEFAMTSPWSFFFAPWQQSHEGVKQIGADRVWEVLTDEAAGAGIVVDHPANHALITMRGGTAVPLFSPVLKSTFDPSAPFDRTLAELRDLKIRFVALTLVSPMTEKLVRAHPFWDTLCRRYQPNSKAGFLSIFDLQHLSPATP